MTARAQKIGSAEFQSDLDAILSEITALQNKGSAGVSESGDGSHPVPSAAQNAAGALCSFRILQETYAYYPTLGDARTALANEAYVSPYPVTLEMAQVQAGRVVWLEIETRAGEDGA